MNDERVEWHLQNWSRWQECNGAELDLWFKDKASVGENYSSRDDHGDHAYDKMCAWWAEAVNAIVDEDLMPAQRAAVYNKHLRTVYRFIRNDEAAHYTLAFESVRRGLTLRAIV